MLEIYSYVVYLAWKNSSYYMEIFSLRLTNELNRNTSNQNYFIGVAKYNRSW